MTYNVVIHAFRRYFLFDLSEEQLAIVIEAHDTGAEKVSIPGEDVAHFSNFRRISVYTNPSGLTRTQLVSALQHQSGRFATQHWDEGVLQRLGTDVTREKVLFGYGGKPKAGGLADQVLSSTGVGLWNLLHPRIAEVSRPLYEDSHFKEAVQAAVIAIDEQVSANVAGQGGPKRTGKDLMLAAFAETAPIIRLFPTGDPDAKPKQEGYKFLYAGMMLAIRNPIAHRNFTVDEADAIHLLFLASWLLRRLDEAVTPTMA